jgi:hypothetical protein
MVAGLRVQDLPIGHADELICALCGSALGAPPNVHMVYADRLPVGLVCADCIAHPHEAAEGARKRAREIRAMAREAEDAVPRTGWIRLLQIAHSRANYWDDLAARIEMTSAEPADEASAREAFGL